jgi:hypothetical protein
MDKRPYVPSRLAVHDPKDVPEWIQFRVQLLRDGLVPTSSCSTVVDQHRKFIDIPDELWRTGHRVLIRYEARLRANNHIQSSIALVQTI